MKLSFMQALILAVLWSLSTSVQAQVTNGDFETQRPGVPPRGRNNVAGIRQTYDDLPGWQALYNPGINSGTADFLATNATNPDVNPNTTIIGGRFTPHNGSTGCVVITRELYTYTHDQFITQQVSLQALHVYKVNFYVLRRPGNDYKTTAERMLFAVNSTAPTGVTYSSFQAQDEQINPVPYTSFTSDPITDYANWTLVTGQFTAQSSTSYITIGYSPQPGIADATTNSAAGYAIDDVSLTDLTCNIPYPQVIQDNPENWRNKNQAQFGITNRVPNVDYTITNIQYANPTVQPGTTRSSFIVKGGYGNPGPVYYGYFTITATSDCNSITTDPIEVEYRIGTTPGGRTASSEATTAYPNPASESITIPDRAEGATLINDKGKTLRTTDASGKLDVQNLPDGLYNLQMTQNGKLINQRIQVKH